jgi:hypothetical protein
MLNIIARDMAKTKKRAAYVEYAIHNKQRYLDMVGKKNLSIPELVRLASPDWENESDDVKDYFKAVAKGDKPVSLPSRHETSCQRMDTEAVVVTRMSE